MKKNPKKRALAALLLVLMVSVGLSGCGKQEPKEAVTIRVGSLKGPTSLGILSFMEKAASGETKEHYEFQMETAAANLLPLLAKDELDIALVPANVAAAFYEKQEGGICVIDINTLGVLSLVTASDEVHSIADLKGRTIALTGKGTTPEASIRYLCDAYGLKENEYQLEFMSEASQVVNELIQKPDVIGLLPQPFVTAALMQNDRLSVVVDLNDAWMQTQDTKSGMVTGVTIVRRQFLEENPEAVESFLSEHKSSVDTVKADTQAAAQLAVNAGIVGAEPVALKAIPECHLVCITGQEMKDALEAYLEILWDFQKELVGGKMPEEDFYYLGK